MAKKATTTKIAEGETAAAETPDQTGPAASTGEPSGAVIAQAAPDAPQPQIAEGEMAPAETPAQTGPAATIGESSGAVIAQAASDAPQPQDAAGTDAGGAEPAPSDAAAMADIEVSWLRGEFPLMTAAIEAWRATSSEPPRAVRIVAKVDGFRRSGMSHSSQATEHPLEAFVHPELLEALFAEPVLTVDFI